MATDELSTGAVEFTASEVSVLRLAPVTSVSNMEFRIDPDHGFEAYVLVEPDGCRVSANVVRLKDPALALKSVCVDVFGHEHWAAASQIKRYREYGNPTDQ